MFSTWQDVLVTLIAAGAALMVLRPLIPAGWLGRKPATTGACPSCASGSACAAVPPVSASSTPVIQVHRRRS